MSELKYYPACITTPKGKFLFPNVYLKDEADKVIAEWKNYADEVNKDFELVVNQNERLLKIVRHNKYKRCLAMAKACKEKSERMYCEASTAKSLNEILGKEPNDAVVEKFELWGAIACTHCKRWHELAEKFKEAK